MSGLNSELSTLSAAGTTAEKGCPGGEGPSILKFGKSIPFIELFEAFLVIGFVGLLVSTSIYYTFVRINAMLTEDPNAASKAAQIAQTSADAQSLWIVLSILLIILAFVFYYIHRRST